MIKQVVRLSRSKSVAIAFIAMLVLGMMPTSAFAVDTTPPTVVSVSPSGTGAPAPSGTITIVFSEPMDTSMTYLQNMGVVTLGTASGASVTYEGQTGLWVNDTTFEIPYPHLGYSLTSTVVIQYFRDVAGNAMVTDSSHSFTTMADPGTSDQESTGTANPIDDLLNNSDLNSDGSVPTTSAVTEPWTSIKVGVSSPADATLRDPKGTVTLRMEAQYSDPAGRNVLTLALFAAPASGSTPKLKIIDSSIIVTIGGVDVTDLGVISIEDLDNGDGTTTPAAYWTVVDPDLVAQWADQPIVMTVQVGLADPASVSGKQNMGVGGIGYLGVVDLQTGEIDDTADAYAVALGPWSIDITPTPAPAPPKGSALPATGDNLFPKGGITLIALIGVAGAFAALRRRRQI